MASDSRQVTHLSPTRQGASPNISVIERAFQLARSGRCSAVQDIRYRLKIEGYSDAQVTGMILLRQLKALMKASRAV